MFNLYFVARNKMAIIEGFKRGNKLQKANNDLMTDNRDLRIFFTDKLSLSSLKGQNDFRSLEVKHMCEAAWF